MIFLCLITLGTTIAFFLLSVIIMDVGSALSGHFDYKTDRHTKVETVFNCENMDEDNTPTPSVDGEEKEEETTPEGDAPTDAPTAE